VYRTASPLVNITEQDLANATNAAMATSGGGLSTKGIKAYHSSPHDFERFDLSKIGTGEGAQVYGHGIYAAENPAVSGQGGQYWNQFLNRFSGPEREVAERLKASNFDRKAAAGNLDEEMAWLEYNAKHANSPEAAAKHTKMLDALRALESGAPVGPRTYELNIRADPAQMLDWDKPIAQQQQVMDMLARSRSPKVREIIERPDNLLPTRDAYGRDIGPVTGEDIYKSVSLAAEGRTVGPKATPMFANAGIPGIKYLDEGSRGIPTAIADIERAIKQGGTYKGAGPDMWASRLDELKQTPLTNNYVVFDPNIIDIMRKYGLAGAAPVGLGALAAQDSYNQGD
jgi:hypothetical protein